MYTKQHTAETCPGRPCAEGCDHVEFVRGSKPYNGHHCWNCWNVSLWISNDEGLYNLALDCIRRPRASGKPVSATIAANRFAEASGLTRTPDGAKYTFKAVRACMVGLMEE